LTFISLYSFDLSAFICVHRRLTVFVVSGDSLATG
jgi:hypothetical protein